MLGRISQRYLLAVLAFLVAAVVTGVGVVSSLECLLVFSAVYAAGAAYQQRELARRRPAPPRRRARRVVAEAADEWAHAADWPSAL